MGNVRPIMVAGDEMEGANGGCKTPNGGEGREAIGG